MISRNIFPKALLFITLGLLVGCTKAGSAPPQIGEIKANPGTTIMVSDKASLTIDVSGSELKFEWSALRGSLTDPSQPNVIYTAPDSPGPDTVTVKIKYNGGETIKTKDFDVVAAPPPPATDTPVPTDTPTPTATPTLTPIPKPIACNNVVVTKNLFPQLAEVDGQYSIYGPVGESRLLCQAVYDIVHNRTMAIHIKFESYQANYAWWGVAFAKMNPYNAASHNQICFWAYAKEHNQSFKLKMKDTAGHEKGIVITIDKPSEWQEVCTDVTEFVKLVHLGIKGSLVV